MSVFKDWGSSLSGPFESWAGTFKTLFTRPGQLKAADIPTLLLPIPGVGSTITYDISHPSATLYQGATLAALSGGAYLAAPAAPAAAPAGSSAAALNGMVVNDFGQIVPVLPAGPLGPAAAEAAAANAGIESSFALTAPAFPGVAAAGTGAGAGASSGGVLAALSARTKGFFAFAKDALAVTGSAAALKNALAPPPTQGPGGGSGGASVVSRPVPVSAGGGN